MLNSPESPRVLLDECLPKKLKREFKCAVSTVPETGWAGKKNGELMKLVDGRFTVFVTADQNLRYQQNLAYANIGVVVLVARDNRLPILSPLMPQVNEAVKTVRAGQVVEVTSEEL